MRARTVPGTDETPPAPPAIVSIRAAGVERFSGSIWMLTSGVVSAALYVALALTGDLRSRLGVYLAVHAALFVVYASVVLRAARAARPALPRAVVLGFAIAFRAVLVLAPASLSDDVQRYVWDGRVQAAGINPYRYAPAAEELRALRDEAWKGINHGEIRTIYPPAAEWLFLAAASAGLRETGFKTLFCAFDLALVLVLWEVLRRLGKPPVLAVVYAWNPLVVVEIASSGHSEPLGLFLLLCSTAFIIGGRRTLSIATYAGSCLARLFPLVLAPLYLRRIKPRHAALGVLLLAAGFVPYAKAGVDLFSGLRAYAGNWDYNSVVFPAVRSFLDRTIPVETLKGLITAGKEAIGNPAWCRVLYEYVWPGPLARLVLAATMILGAFALASRTVRTERALLLITGLFLVLTPTLHPWYVLWVIPFAAIELSYPWILFTGLVPLSYLSVLEADGRVPVWVLAVEWGFPAALGAWRLLSRYKARATIRALESPLDR